MSISEKKWPVTLPGHHPHGKVILRRVRNGVRWRPGRVGRNRGEPHGVRSHETAFWGAPSRRRGAGECGTGCAERGVRNVVSGSIGSRPEGKKAVTCHEHSAGSVCERDGLNITRGLKSSVCGPSYDPSGQPHHPQGLILQNIKIIVNTDYVPSPCFHCSDVHCCRVGSTG